MKSTITWIDHDQESSERSMRILSFFQQKESRDELGLGGIRDSFSDQLFPGTSTVHTRLRYMLFIPWMYRELELQKISSDDFARLADEKERDLIEHFNNLGNLDGVMGAQAGRNLNRLPSSAYWTGLGKWKIREVDVSQGSYHQTIEKIYLDRKNQSIWHKLPKPEKFPYKNFDLTKEEAEYLYERIQSMEQISLFASLANLCGSEKANTFFEESTTIEELNTLVSADGSFSREQRELLKNAVMFSHVMFGAALVYNWELAKLRNSLIEEMKNDSVENEENDSARNDDEDWVEYYEAKLNNWFNDLNLVDVSEIINGTKSVNGEVFLFNDFWKLTMKNGHTITESTCIFVNNWINMLLKGTINHGNFGLASELIRDREIELKKGKSRFKNKRALKQWRGGSGLTPMDFRWHIARGYLIDLHEGLNRVDKE